MPDRELGRPWVVGPAGVALGLVAGATYAGYSWTLRRLMNRHVPRGAATGAVLGLGGVILAPIAIGLTLTASIPTTAWLVLVHLAIVPMFLGYVLFSRGSRRGRRDNRDDDHPRRTRRRDAARRRDPPRAPGVRGWTGMALLALALVILVTPARRT